MAPDHDWPELGSDALDPPRPPAAVEWRWFPRRRPALGVRSTLAPSLVFVLCGVLFGPFGLNVLSRSALDQLDMVVPVALAVLGVFVGLGTTTIPREFAKPLLVGGAIGSTATMVLVTGGVILLLTSWGLRLPMHPVPFAAIVGVCASASAAVHRGSDEMRRAAYLADVDDVPLVVLGTVVTAMVANAGSGFVVLRLALTVVAGGGIGLAGWLLFDRAAGAAERGVFVTGAVLLAAGVGVYLGTSPLLAGGIAAVVWVRAPGAADHISAADLRVLQHPLLALLLIVAGALIEWSLVVLWIAAAIVVLRLTAKLVASLAVAPMLRIPPGLLANALLPPGVLGIALALNVRQVLASETGVVVGAVTAAAAASELVAMFLPQHLEDGS